MSDYEIQLDQSRVEEVREIAGVGIAAKVEGKEILAGNAKLIQEYGIA